MPHTRTHITALPSPELMETNDVAPPAYTKSVVKEEQDLQPLSFDVRPMVIPQTTTTLLNAFLFPFARAYPTALQAHGMDQAEFLRFLDGLNEAFMLSPVFRILGIAGRITSFTPSLIAMGVGIGVSVASGVAGAAMSYARTRAYVRRWNAERFAKMGLRVRILSTKDMMKAVEGEKGASSSSSSSVSLTPLPEFDQPWTPSSAMTDPRIRRIDALQDKVAPLNWDVPPAETPENRLKRMGAWQARKSEAKVTKQQRKMCKKMNKACRKDNVEKQAKLKRKMEKKEDKVTQRIRWIVIVPSNDEEEQEQEDESKLNLGLEM